MMIAILNVRKKEMFKTFKAFQDIKDSSFELEVSTKNHTNPCQILGLGSNIETELLSKCFPSAFQVSSQMWKDLPNHQNLADTPK